MYPVSIRFKSVIKRYTRSYYILIPAFIRKAYPVLEEYANKKIPVEVVIILNNRKEVGKDGKS